uniref:Uncharacterized protein n=1 Tax=Myoviridae sp. ctncN39 TaxID=2825170 RepID=A0A8S5V2B1_9CAUD|nr:MAG TPA: hypothetical protein [Myoviridae sp. ctncN39]
MDIYKIAQQSCAVKTIEQFSCTFVLTFRYAIFIL